MSDRPEVWLRGPVDGVPSLLQPVAHALLQAREEVESALVGFPAHKLWERPAGVASVGFHLQHLAGVLDRLFTYARGETLTEAQFEALRSEAEPRDQSASTSTLIAQLSVAVEKAVAELRVYENESLTESREVGRARLPSTVLGLLFHAAEHTQRHVGQLLVTARVVQMDRSR